MLTRRKALLGMASLGLAACGGVQTTSSPVLPATQSRYSFVVNDFTAGVIPPSGVQKRFIESGESWESLFPNNVEVGQHLNRQNRGLAFGQAVLVPDGPITMADINPFPSVRQLGSGYHVIFDHSKYAWALYGNGELVRWGAAIGGSKTTRGSFTVTEMAGPDRVSNIYPLSTGGGAAMPYFMRITAGGIGLHAGQLRGKHESEGCIRMLYDDAMWLNLDIARPHGLRVTVV
jgi:hypothetical protein